MTIVFTVLTLAVLGVVAAVAVGRIGGGLDEAASSLPSEGPGPGPLTAQDLETVRFSPALRGYRMDEVDGLLDRLGEELRRRDDEIARLTQGATADYTRPVDEDPVPGPVVEPAAVPTVPAVPADER